MNAYFASQVAINIASSAPILGSAMQQLLSGGAGMGTLTINRFFGLHVWLMPAILALLVVVHLIVFRHNGSAGPPTDRELKKLPQGRFWPNQMFMDAAASLIVFAIMVLLSIFSPAPFDVKADPTQRFIAYPAWYFLALYGMLRVAGQVPGALVPIANLIATIVIPTDHHRRAHRTALDRPQPEPAAAPPHDRARRNGDRHDARHRALDLQSIRRAAGASRDARTGRGGDRRRLAGLGRHDDRRRAGIQHDGHQRQRRRRRRGRLCHELRELSQRGRHRHARRISTARRKSTSSPAIPKS